MPASKESRRVARNEVTDSAIGYDSAVLGGVGRELELLINIIIEYIVHRGI